jgi:ribonuclease HI
MGRLFVFVARGIRAGIRMDVHFVFTTSSKTVGADSMHAVRQAEHPRPGRRRLPGRYVWLHDGTWNVRRRRLWPQDLVADQPGKMAGEAAIGVVLKAPLEEISEPIGPAQDHHVAEYRALIRGLEAARSREIGHIRVCLDSALLVNQLNGRWKVKAEHLKPLHKQALSSIQQFADIKITWVPRKANAEADALASPPLGPPRP